MFVKKNSPKEAGMQDLKRIYDRTKAWLTNGFSRN